MEKKRDFKKDFDKYLVERFDESVLEGEFMVLSFYEYDKSMQCGVYVDFFDSVGFNLELHGDKNKKQYVWYVMHPHHIIDDATTSDSIIYNTRREAREKALEKAIEIYEHG